MKWCVVTAVSGSSVAGRRLHHFVYLGVRCPSGNCYTYMYKFEAPFSRVTPEPFVCILNLVLNLVCIAPTKFSWHWYRSAEMITLSRVPNSVA
jgi:hypothetical protein